MFEKDLYRTLAENLPGFGIFMFDRDVRYTMALGDELLSSMSLRAEDVVGKLVKESGVPLEPGLLMKNFRETLEGVSKDVEVHRLGRAYSMRFAPVRSQDGSITSGIMTCHDVTEIVKARDSLRILSLSDELTGAYNRRGFTLLAEQQLKLLDRSNSGALIFFVDLNDLKVINDTMGHEAGDEALRTAARVLKSSFRESDIVARYGGDEFVVFTTDVGLDMEPVFRERLRQAVVEFNTAARFKLSLSMGCSFYNPAEPASLDSLISDADERMYKRKKHWKAFGSSSNLPSLRDSMAAAAKAKMK